MDALERRLSSLSVRGRSAPTDPVYLLSLSLAPPPGDSVLVSCSDFSLRLHDKRTLRLLQTYGGHAAPVSNVLFTHTSADTFLSASLDGTVRLWDVRRSGTESDRVLRSDPAHCFSSFGVSCDDRLVCAGTEQINGEDSFLVFWDVRKPSTLLGVYSESHSDDITQVLFHPTLKDRLASGSTDGLVNVFDLTKGEEDDALMATCNSESSVSALCWLGPEQTRPDQTRPEQTRPEQTRPEQTRPDQTRPEQTRLLCVSHDEGLKLWDLESLETEDELTIYSSEDARTTVKDQVSSVDYLIGGCWLDSEGLCLVVGGNAGGDVHLFSCGRPGLNPVRTLSAGHRSTVRTFGFDSHSLSLFTGGEDGALLKWSPEEEEERGVCAAVTSTACGSSREQQKTEEQKPEEQNPEEQRRRREESFKSDSVMRLKSRPHRKHKFNRDRKTTGLKPS